MFKRGRGYRSPRQYKPGIYARTDFEARADAVLSNLPEVLEVSAAALVAMDAARLNEQERGEFLRLLSSPSQA